MLRVAKKLLPGVITIMGGPHVTTSADEVIRHAAVDFVIKGQAEFSFQLLLKTLGDGCGNFNDVPGLVFKSAEGVTSIPVQIAQEIDHVRPPDYGFIDLEEYWKRGYRLNSRHAKNAPLWVTRGCPYKCSFCSAPNLNGRPVRVHSVAFMRVWILHLYHQFGVRWFNIIDDNFTFNVEYAKEFCRMVKGLGLDIKFGTPNGIRVQRGDVELWRLMKDAGWETVIVAPESGSKKSLLKMRKDLNLDIIPGTVEAIKKTGLKVHGLFLIGYPGDERGDLELTRKFIMRCQFDFFYLNVFQPLPGTPIYDELVKSGEITDGLLPNSYSEGTRSYVTKGLIGFNFPFFVLKVYAEFALRSPRKVAYLFYLYDPRFLVKKLGKNIFGVFRKSAVLPISENMVVHD